MTHLGSTSATPAALAQARSAPPDTSPRIVEQTAARLRDGAESFARAPLPRKVAALREVRGRLAERGPEFARLGCLAKGLDPSAASYGEELLAGAVVIQRYVRLLTESLEQIQERGAPHVPDDCVRRLANGEVAVQLMPHSLADRALFMPYEIEARLDPGVDTGHLAESQANFYAQNSTRGSVCAVLGAGNVASIPALDVLHQAFVEGRVSLLKMSPVNAYLGPLFEHVFAPLTDLGALGIVYGRAEVGKALLASPNVDHVHMTGSTETHDLIVWGAPGPEREQRLARDQPLLRQSITSELGNISPVVVVPGRWTAGELEQLAQSIAGMLFNNASFNCNAAKLLVLPKALAPALTDRLSQIFAEYPARLGYYPGAAERYRELTQAAEIRRAAPPAADGTLPWTLLLGLAPGSSALPLRLEPFCPILSVATLDESEAESYLERATRFLNEEVWGTLNAMLFVPRDSEAAPHVQAAVDRAIDALEYGTIAVNYWPALGYGLGTPPWGGHPSATLKDAQSGIGFVHNALMLERVRKVVLRGPFRSLPKPIWYPNHRSLGPLARALFDFESTGSALAFTRTALHGLVA